MRDTLEFKDAQPGRESGVSGGVQERKLGVAGQQEVGEWGSAWRLVEWMDGWIKSCCSIVGHPCTGKMEDGGQVQTREVQNPQFIKSARRSHVSLSEGFQEVCSVKAWQPIRGVDSSLVTW